MGFPFNEQEYRSMLNAISDPLHVVDTDGVLVFVNRAWEKMFDAPSESVLGLFINDAIEKSNAGFYFSFEKDSAEGKLQFTHFPEKRFDSVALSVLQTKKPISMFAYSPRKERIIVTSSPIRSDDSVRFVLTTFKDLTEFSNLSNQLENAIQTNKLISDELEFYRSKSISENDNVVGESQAVRNLLKNIQYVAATDATVLITGESGVGKEVFTNEIYRLSKRKSGPFIRINCASIPESLLESELFGYEKGAFTGAVKSKPGMFELANNGTLLLDEVGDLPKALQPKLLRALQEHEIMRVGGTAAIQVDVRLIAATNQDLEAMVKRGDFRRDLYYRLNIIPLYIPPLRERVEDIPLLAEHFLKNFNGKYGKSKTIGTDAMHIMQEYPWPGNIRELENLLERLVIIGDENLITSVQVSKILGSADPSSAAPAGNGGEPGVSLKDMVCEYEKRILQEAFDKYKTSYRVAEALNSSQPTIARKAKQYGLER